MAAIVNFVAFQVGWFACILPAAAGRPWVGPVYVLVSGAAHVALARRRAALATLLLLAALVGYVADSSLVVAGLLSFPESARLGGPSTLWMAAMWANLATTLHLSLAWLGRRYLLGAALGLVAGPIAYATGAGFGAIALGTSTAASLAAVGVEWALAMPLLMWLAATVGVRASRAPAIDAVPEAAP